MKKGVFLVLLIVLLAVTVTACKPPEPEPEPVVEPEVPPEPTPEMHYQQMKGVLGPLLSPGVAPPDEMIQGILSGVQGKRSQMAMSENGRVAIGMISRDVDEMIRESRREERWKKIKALCLLYTVLQPGNDRYASLLEQAEIMLNRPKITVTGFVELDNELYAFMELFDPKTGETTPYRRREGEEFHDVMRIVRIVGNQQSVEVEYLPARYVWTVPGPRERARSE